MSVVSDDSHTLSLREWWGHPTTVNSYGENYQIRIYHKRRTGEYFAAVNESSDTLKRDEIDLIFDLLRFSNNNCIESNDNSDMKKVWINKNTNTFASFYTVGQLPSFQIPYRTNPNFIFPPGREDEY